MEMILLVFSVFFIALVFSMFGMGGGLFYMPLFLCLFAPQEASLYSYSCIFVTSSSAMYMYNKKRLIDWTLVGFLGVPLIVMVFLSGLFLKHLSCDLLKTILGTTLVVAGVLMLAPVKGPGGRPPFIAYFRKKFPHEKYNMTPSVLSPVTMCVGLLCGISGVAGGVFEVPIMVGLSGTSSHVAVATSSAIVCLASLLGILGRIFSFSPAIPAINGWFILAIIFCAHVGGRLGPNLSVKVSKPVFKRICGVFIFLMGVFYFFNSVL